LGALGGEIGAPPPYMGMRASAGERNWVGSVVLAVLVALLVLRPSLGGLPGPSLGGLLGLGGGGEPASAVVRVARVVDGDTILVRLDGREQYVRLIGVDTPETVKPDTPVQCFGPRASHFTHRSLEGRTVRLVFGVERHDVYGRLLAYVYLGRRPFESELAARGLARPLTIPPNDRFAPLFERLARRAARSGRGLWGACTA
jgi:micrococcal nuclease